MSLGFVCCSSVRVLVHELGTNLNRLMDRLQILPVHVLGENLKCAFSFLAQLKISIGLVRSVFVCPSVCPSVCRTWHKLKWLDRSPQIFKNIL